MKLYIKTNGGIFYPEVTTSDNHSVIWIYSDYSAISIAAARGGIRERLFATIRDFGDVINVESGKGKNDFASFTIGRHERGGKQ
jgi:hypothetical protein